MGDAMRGDYYRGDPGLFSFVGKSLRGVASAVASHFGVRIPPGRFKVGGGVSLVPLQQRGLINIGGRGPQTGLINIGGMDRTATGMSAGAGFGFSTPDGQAPMRGYHLNKSTYETRGGGTSRWPAELELHEKGTVVVRNRRTNVGNARALKRSLHRVAGFARLARRVMSFTHPRAGRGHFKFRKRKK
jgi:hypothetical protein